MKNEPFSEQSTAERENRLWSASEKYMRGDISIDDFEAVELPYAQDFKRANLVSTEPITKSRDTSYFIGIVVVALIMIGLFAFFLTKNWVLLLVTAAPAYFVGPRIVYYFIDKRKKA